MFVSLAYNLFTNMFRSCEALAVSLTYLNLTNSHVADLTGKTDRKQFKCRYLKKFNL